MSARRVRRCQHSRGSIGKERSRVLGPQLLEVVAECTPEELHAVLDAARAPRLVQLVDHRSLHAQGKDLEGDALAVRVLSRAKGNATLLRLPDLPDQVGLVG